MPGGGELFGERNRGVAPPDHRPVGGRVARAEVEAVCGNEPRRNVASEPEASVKFPEPLLAGRRDEERRIVAALRDDFNALLGALSTAGFMAPVAETTPEDDTASEAQSE